MSGAPSMSPAIPLRAALTYAARGLAVFPCWEITPDGGDCACPRSHPSRDAAGHCGSPGKHPRTANGVKDATRDAAAIQKWWQQWPRAHVAIAAGASGLLVVDVDPRNGGDGTLADLERTHGALPDTPRQLTGGGGVHLLFKRPERPHVRGPRHGLGRGVDIKCDGGYFIAAPSGHISGGAYVWEIGSDPDDLPIAEPPAWLLAVLDTRTLQPAATTTSAVGDGLLGAALALEGWLGRPLGTDKAAARCPQEDQHSTGARFNGSTIVYAPQKPGGVGWFHCSHGHCLSLSSDDVLERLPAATVEAARAALAGRGIKASARPASPDAPMPGDDDAPPEPPRTPRAPRTTGDGGGNGARPGARIPRRQRVGGGDLGTILATDPAWAGCLEYDAFADRITWRRPPPVVEGLPRPAADAELQDTDLTYVAHWAALERHWSVGKDATHEAIAIAARTRVQHPARSYLESLAWDGRGRLGRWLETYAGAVAHPTTTMIGRWSLIAAVARIFRPGCQADHVLILEGPQGTGKSGLVRALAGPWYLPQLPNLQNERPGQDLQGHWLVEIAELDAFRGISVSRIKDFVSRTLDVYRPSYGRCTITRPRQCVFIGTTNDETYLRDPTGARRFWPVTVGRIQLAALVADRDQLWAEAVEEYRAGTPWFPDPSWYADLAELQESRFEDDPWEILIARHCEGLGHVSIDEVLEGPLRKAIHEWTRADQMRVADVLKRLGWHRRRAGGSRQRRWFAPSADEQGELTV